MLIEKLQQRLRDSSIAGERLKKTLASLTATLEQKEKAEKGLAQISGKPNNPGFLAKAPESVVAAEKEKAEKYEALIKQLTESEARLKAL